MSPCFSVSLMGNIFPGDHFLFLLLFVFYLISLFIAWVGFFPLWRCSLTCIEQSIPSKGRTGERRRREKETNSCSTPCDSFLCMIGSLPCSSLTPFLDWLFWAGELWGSFLSGLWCVEQRIWIVTDTSLLLCVNNWKRSFEKWTCLCFGGIKHSLAASGVEYGVWVFHSSEI